MLNSKGRISLPADIATWLIQSRENTQEALVTHEIVLAAHRLFLTHADHPDRFLPATAQVLELTLVTAEKHLLKIRDIKTMANG